MILMAMHRKRLYYQEFGVESEEEECFREHKRFLSEELSRRIAELKIKDGNVQVANNNNVVSPRSNNEHVNNGTFLLHESPNFTTTHSPTNLSQDHKKALALYTPPIITATDAKGDTKMLSSPPILRTNTLENLMPHPILSHYLQPKKLSQQIVLYKDPKELFKQAYNKLNNNNDDDSSSNNTQMEFDENMGSSTNNSNSQEVLEEIDVEELMQDDEQIIVR